MVELDPSSLRKREAWAQREQTESYIQQMGAYAVARDEAIVRSMLGSGPGNLLDIPCGTGRYFRLAKELGWTITAADYSPTMMRVAKQHEDIKFVQADVFDPPFARESFDAILISRLLFHYARPEEILGKLLPSLKPGGRMVFDTLNKFSTRWSASQAQHLLCRDPARRLYFETRRSMSRKLEALGLKVQAARSAYLMPTRLYRFLPRPLTAVADVLEKVTPRCMRVLTFWQVGR